MLACLVLLAFMFSIPATAGDKKITKKDVPSAVLKAFEQAYPKAKVKGFAKEKENGTMYYELETIDGKTKRDLLYTADGKAAEIEETVTLTDLPEAVAKAFAIESPTVQPTKIEKVTRGEKVTYDFGMGKGKSELVIDPSGNIIKHSKAVKNTEEKEEDEKED
jgi:hypothetical protein